MPPPNYVTKLCAQHGVLASSIVHGMPVGSELEIVEGTTLSY
ncbi:MAG: hypothetical protein ACSLEM_05375 [Candidatus Malihini olakiniferum]